MRVYLTLVRRELGGFFGSLTGYVIIASVLLLLGLSFTSILGILNDNPIDVPLTELFYKTDYFWIILLLTTPVITMRSFAFEKGTGTYETLMTTPVSETKKPPSSRRTNVRYARIRVFLPRGRAW